MRIEDIKNSMNKADNYRELTDRNIGIITEKQQERLKKSSVAIFGVGGLGGVIAELLCRCGIGHIKIIDDGCFEPSNLNRQIFCFRSTVDKSKTEVTERFLKDINPRIKIERYSEEDSLNIGKILEGVDLAVLAVDKVKACIAISRAAKGAGIPLVEGWAIPYGNVRVFTKDTLSLEEAYNLPSMNKKVEEFNEEEFKKMDILMLESLTKIEGIGSFYNEEARQRIMQGKNPCFAPLVWLTAVLMSLEAIKVLLDWGEAAFAPKFALYDPFLRRIPQQNLSQGR